MANYFAVFNRRAQTSNQVAEPKKGTVKILPAQATAPLASGQFEDALVVRLEAASVAEAQGALYGLYPGVITGTPVIIEEAQFKES